MVRSENYFMFNLKDVVKFTMAQWATLDDHKNTLLFFLDAVLLRRSLSDQSTRWTNATGAHKIKLKFLDFCEVCGALFDYARCTNPVPMKCSFCFRTSLNVRDPTCVFLKLCMKWCFVGVGSQRFNYVQKQKQRIKAEGHLWCVFDHRLIRYGHCFRNCDVCMEQES